MDAEPRSALYVGEVRHHRRRPKVHAFRYPVFMAFLNLDRLDELAGVSRLVAHNRFAWAAVHDADFLPDRTEATLREKVDAAVQAEGLPRAHRVFLLGNLRYLGWAFNPVCYFYGFDAEGRICWICAEVTNTPWKERHRYWMVPESNRLSFEVAKAMHVSPFMPMGLRYRWTFSAPGEGLTVHMGLYDQDVLCFDAILRMERRPWSASEVGRTLVRYPWMTLKVMAAIHWEALWLWIKRIPVFTHPAKLEKAKG